MASKRDLVEAHGYNRRRLVTAFVSGAPGGREVEPVRYGRTVVGGLVLALVIVAGAAVSGFLKPPIPKGWDQQGLVIGKSSGSRFYADKGRLYPILNITSAKLLLGKDSSPTLVPDDLIAQRPQSHTIGIQGAPEVLPKPSALSQSGWTACTNAYGGIAVTLARHSVSQPVTGQAFRVSADGQQFVIAGNRRYPVAQSTAGETVLRSLKLDTEPAAPVPGLWLDLVPSGSTLEVPSVPGAGQPVRTKVAGLTAAGDVVDVDGRDFVLSARGRLQQLTPFAAALYLGGRTPQKLTAQQVAGVPTDTGAAPYPQDWPQDAVTPYTGTSSPCLRLTTKAGAVATVSLATTDDKSALPVGGAISRDVEVGSGAVVSSTTGGVIGAGPANLVDGSGTTYVVGSRGDRAGALAALGYGKTDAVPVPAAWLALFAPGPQLSAAAAGQTPSQATTQASQSSGSAASSSSGS